MWLFFEILPPIHLESFHKPSCSTATLPPCNFFLFHVVILSMNRFWWPERSKESEEEGSKKKTGNFSGSAWRKKFPHVSPLPSSSFKFIAAFLLLYPSGFSSILTWLNPGLCAASGRFSQGRSRRRRRRSTRFVQKYPHSTFTLPLGEEKWGGWFHWEWRGGRKWGAGMGRPHTLKALYKLGVTRELLLLPLGIVSLICWARYSTTGDMALCISEILLPYLPTYLQSKIKERGERDIYKGEQQKNTYSRKQNFFFFCLLVNSCMKCFSVWREDSHYELYGTM